VFLFFFFIIHGDYLLFIIINFVIHLFMISTFFMNAYFIRLSLLSHSGFTVNNTPQIDAINSVQFSNHTGDSQS